MLRVRRRVIVLLRSLFWGRCRGSSRVTEVAGWSRRGFAGGGLKSWACLSVGHSGSARMPSASVYVRDQVSVSKFQSLQAYGSNEAMWPLAFISKTDHASASPLVRFPPCCAPPLPRRSPRLLCWVWDSIMSPQISSWTCLAFISLYARGQSLGASGTRSHFGCHLRCPLSRLSVSVLVGPRWFDVSSHSSVCCS